MNKTIKNILISLISTILITNIAYGKRGLDWKGEHIKGRVKYFTQTRYNGKEVAGKIQKGNKDCHRDCEQIFFDINGNMLEKVKYKSDGNLDYKLLYKYDTNGNVIEEGSYKPNGDINQKSIFEYDTRGNIIEENKYKSNGRLNYKVTHKYDTRGNKLETNTYLPDGSLYYRFTYKYDTKGNKLEKSKYSSSGHLLDKKAYKYDTKGNKKSQKNTTSQSTKKAIIFTKIFTNTMLTIIKLKN